MTCCSHEPRSPPGLQYLRRRRDAWPWWLPLMPGGGYSCCCLLLPLPLEDFLQMPTGSHSPVCRPLTSPPTCRGSVKPGVKQLPEINCGPNYYVSKADAHIVLGRKLVDAYFIKARGPLLPEPGCRQLPAPAALSVACLAFHDDVQPRPCPAPLPAPPACTPGGAPVLRMAAAGPSLGPEEHPADRPPSPQGSAQPSTPARPRHPSQAGPAPSAPLPRTLT